MHNVVISSSWKPGKTDAVILILQIRKLRHRPGKAIFHVLTACPWQSGTQHTVLSAWLECVGSPAIWASTPGIIMAQKNQP